MLVRLAGIAIVIASIHPLVTTTLTVVTAVGHIGR